MAKQKQPDFIISTILDGAHGHYLARSSDSHSLKSGQVRWQHLDLNDAYTLPWLANTEKLDPIVCEALTAKETRPRSMKIKDGLFLVLRGINLNPGNEAEDMVSLRLWIEADRILSIRNRPVLSAQDILKDLNEGHGPRSSGEFLTELVEKMADRVGDFVNDIEEELETTEDALESIGAQEMRTKLGALRRQIAMVRRYMAPQRDALDRLYHIENFILTERDRQRLREESDRVSRYLEDLDLARERAVVLQEAFLSQIAQQQNKRMYALSIVSIIFLPLGFLTGLLGINIGGIPGADNAQAFWIFIAILLGVVSIQFWLLRKLKWI